MFMASCNKENPAVDNQQVPAERVVYLDASAPATRAGITLDSEGNGFTIDSWTEGDVIRMVYLKDSQYTSLDFEYNVVGNKFQATLPADVESIEDIKSDVSGLVYCAGQLNSENGVVALNPSEIKVDKDNKTTNLSLFASKESIAFNGNEVSARMIMDYAIVAVSNKTEAAKGIRFAKKVGEDFIGLVSLACSPAEGIVAAYAAESGVSNAFQFTVPAGDKVYFPIAHGEEIGIFNADCTPLKNSKTLAANTTYNVDIEDAPTEPTDLSEGGKANTYIVVGAGNYKFPTVKGNSEVSVGDVASVEVLWESFGTNVAPAVGDLVSSAAFKDGYISFVASDKKGNAVIAAKDATGTILWSWHIWMTDQPGIQEYYCNQAGKPKPQMMDRNLGATSATPGQTTSLGLFYQWGRKDPFMGPSGIATNSFAASTLNWPASVASNATVGTIQYATEHPTTFISNNADGNWLNTRDTNLWKEEPTIYDPCPAGYRLPYNNVWTWSLGTSNSWTTASNFNGTWKGMNFGATDKKMGADAVIWYPDQGDYHQNGSGLVNVGGWGDNWSITLVNNASQVYCLQLGNNGCVNPSAKRNFAYGQAVRCQKIVK